MTAHNMKIPKPPATPCEALVAASPCSDHCGLTGSKLRKGRFTLTHGLKEHRPAHHGREGTAV